MSASSQHRRARRGAPWRRRTCRAGGHARLQSTRCSVSHHGCGTGASPARETLCRKVPSHRGAALRRGEQDTQPCPLARRAPGQAPRSTRAAGRLASAGVGVGLHGAMHRLPTRDTVMRAGCPRARGRRSGGEPGRSTLSPVAWAVDADAGGSRLSALATRRDEACEHAVRMPAVRSPAAAARWSGRAGWSAGLPPPCSRARRTPNQLVPTSRAKAPAAVSAV
jgi:hypothetical protein